MEAKVKGHSAYRPMLVHYFTSPTTKTKALKCFILGQTIALCFNHLPQTSFVSESECFLHFLFEDGIIFYTTKPHSSLTEVFPVLNVFQRHRFIHHWIQVVFQLIFSFDEIKRRNSVI